MITEGLITEEEIPPYTGIIDGMINAEGMTLKKAVAELIANAIDHHAQNVHLNFDDNHGVVTIVDDGWGPPSGLRKAIQLGRHVASKTNPVGKYGVGMKDAACWLANVADINAMTRDGTKESMSVNWAHLQASETWRFVFSNGSTRTSQGMSIRLGELRRNRLRNWKDVPNYVADLFGAALDNGVAITVNGEEVMANAVPALEFWRSFEGEFNGLRYKGFAGILKNKNEADSGWDIRYGPQSIATGYQKEGFGKNSSQGFYGRFEMLEGPRRWHLTRNKTDSEDLFDVLNSDEMQEVIKPLLSRITERGETLRFVANARFASDSLTNLFRRERARIVEEESEDAPKPNKPRTETTEEVKPRPVPDPNRVISKRDRKWVVRAKRVANSESDLVDTVRRAETVDVSYHADPKRHGFSYVDERDQGRCLRVLIDNSSEFGQQVCKSPQMLLHYAVQTLATHLANKIDIKGQLCLPIGDYTGMCDKVAKTLSYLLGNVELDQFFSTNGNK